MGDDAVIIMAKDASKNGTIEINAGDFHGRYEGDGPFEVPRGIYDLYLSDFFDVEE